MIIQMFIESERTHSKSDDFIQFFMICKSFLAMKCMKSDYSIFYFPFQRQNLATNCPNKKTSGKTILGDAYVASYNSSFVCNALLCRNHSFSDLAGIDRITEDDAGSIESVSAGSSFSCQTHTT